MAIPRRRLLLAVNGAVFGITAVLAQACSDESSALPEDAPDPSLGGAPTSGSGGAPGAELGGMSAGGGSRADSGAAGRSGGGASGNAPVAPPGTMNPSPVATCQGPLPPQFTSTCGGCHTAQGSANPRYPDLYEFSGTLAEFQRRVREGSEQGMPAYSAEVISDADVTAFFDYFTGSVSRAEQQVELGGVVALFDAADAVNPPVVFERSDGVLVTRGAGRVRSRHEGPLDTNQPFMEFVADYFVGRTYGWLVEDYTRIGQSKLRVTYLPISAPTAGTNFRAWKIHGDGDVFHANTGMTAASALPSLLGDGVDLAEAYAERIAPYARIQQQETTRNDRENRELRAGDQFEFEFGIFADPAAIEPPGSRTSYYTDTFRYRVGEGGVTADNADPYSDGKGILGPTEAAQQGGATTNVWAYHMPELQFSQMALNIQHENVQRFVEGRRLFHTDFTTGKHSEAANPDFVEQRGKAGPLGTTTSCVSCHENNGPGEMLTGPLGPKSSMIIKLYGADAAVGQLHSKDGSASPSGVEEKTVKLADGTSVVLKKPRLAVTLKGGAAPAFSARIARKLIGLGLLEAVDEGAILGRADMTDCDGDGISGRPSYVADPSTGELRVGRFGWKAEKVGLEHQVAQALHDDMGVGTRLFPDADEAELANDDFDRLVTYMRLLSVPGQRERSAAEVLAGEQLFQTIGCARCHVTDLVTGVNHPFSELRGQSIKPYTDLLLHDMGPDLADTSQSPPPADASAPPSASEWRTPPLWGTGLLSVINGHTGLLHDGRAANVLEAILWHGGEAEATKARVMELSAAERAALVRFVLSL